MRILLLGLYYSNNLGDAVICDCVAARLRAHFPSAQIVVRDFMNRTAFPPAEEVAIRELNRRRRRMQLRRSVSTYLKWDKQAKHEKAQVAKNMAYIQSVCAERYDLAVFAGGQIFADGLALYLEAFVRCLSQRGTPMLFNAAGVGPMASGYIESRLSAALSDPWVRWISSRDDAGRIQRSYLGREKQVAQTFDPALWCADVYHIERDTRSDVVGLGMMYAASVPTGAAIRFWRSLIRMLEKRGIRWRIFVNGSGHDVAFAREVISRLPECPLPFEEYLTPVPRCPEELVKMLSGFRSILSFRLHSHIIAASLDIPSVAIVWDHKLRFFFDKIGHGERCCTVFDRPSAVLKRLEAAEREGYPPELIQRQKHCSDQMLYQAICEELDRTEDIP